MRISGRRPGERSTGIVKAASLLGATVLALTGLPASARDVVVSGTKMDRFGRILLQFDQTTKVQVKSTNSVLVISFGEPSRIRAEKLATELAPYVAVVRRDPDNTGLRLALAAALRPNVLEAGERVYIDLLPQNWTGMPPALPAEVVAELARRAATAEAKLRAEQAKPPIEPRAVKLRLAELPNLTRIVLEIPPGGTARAKEGEGAVQLTFEGVSNLDLGGEKPKLASGVALFETASGTDNVSVKLAAGPGFRANTFREGDTYIVDLTKPSAAPSTPVLPAVPDKQLPRPEMRMEAPPATAPAVLAAPARPVQPEAVVPPVSPPPSSPATIRPEVSAGSDRATIRFPFRSPTPAAAYERAGLVTLVFDTQDVVDRSQLGSLPGLSLVANDEENGRHRGIEVIRFATTAPGPTRLVRDGNAWRLIFAGADKELPPDTFTLSRSTDENGRALAKVAISGASNVHWLREADGSRTAIVTASGRVQAFPLSKAFVEFGLPATLHGLVVDARADDLTVSLGQDGVTITRSAGLTLSQPQSGGPNGSAGAALPTTLFPRDVWASERSGDVMERYHVRLTDAAEAPSSGRAEARFRLARFLVANGMNEEAGSVLGLARREDPVFAHRRETDLLSGIAAIRAGRAQAGRVFLSSDTTQDDPEAALWRALADAGEGRWGQALTGFAKWSDLIDAYPDDLAGPIRLAAVSAAVATGSLARAERELTALDRLPTGSVGPDDHDLARAKLDEAAGRVDAALKTYRKLMDEGGRPAAAAAAERWVALALGASRIDVVDATERLESLSVAWRGGDTEIGTLTQLAALYGQARRWRDMFAVARRANKYFPDHPATRRLHDDATQRLEGLLLGPDREQLSAVQALALYFDFKELAPVGRRGDQIVRRLADRLVELDLLDQASGLLEYQVEKRLTGVARATVAARLAAIRLLNGKPLPALAALQSTRAAELPKEVRHVRFMLEARANSDLGRTDLALESLDGETGPEFDRLRTSILWSGRRWRVAGETGEGLLGTRWQGEQLLTERDRGDVLRATIAYALAEDRLSLDRLREKFGPKMMDSADAKTFEALLKPGAAQTKEFRTAAQEATRADALRTLLSDWRSPEAGAGSVEGQQAAAEDGSRTAETSPAPSKVPSATDSGGAGAPG